MSNPTVKGNPMINEYRPISSDNRPEVVETTNQVNSNKIRLPMQDVRANEDVRVKEGDIVGQSVVVKEAESETPKTNDIPLKYGGCWYITCRIFEYICYPFLSFLSSLLIEMIIGVFYIGLGFVSLGIMIGFFTSMFVFYIGYIACGDPNEQSKEKSRKKCDLATGWMFWAFKNGGWGIILFVYSIVDGFIGLIQTIRVVWARKISPYKIGHDNINTMWECSCLFAKQHNLLSIKLNPEDDKKKQSENNKDNNQVKNPIPENSQV